MTIVLPLMYFLPTLRTVETIAHGKVDVVHLRPSTSHHLEYVCKWVRMGDRE